MAVRVRPLLLVLPLLALGLARAQERPPAPLDAAAARARAAGFLTLGPGAPRPDLTPDELAALVLTPVDHALHGPCFEAALMDGAGRLRLLVRVERAHGRVIGLCQPERECLVRRLDARGRARDPGVVAAEVARRARLDRGALLARARAVLARALGEEAAARFDVRGERDRSEGLVSHDVLLVQRPRDGVVAAFANLAQVSVNPETGDVVDARWTAIEDERRTPPPVGRAGAEALARAHLGARAGAVRGARLGVVVPAPLDVRVVWGVTVAPVGSDAPPVVVLVDAERGDVVGEE